MALIENGLLNLIARLKLTVPLVVGIPPRPQPKGSIVYNVIDDLLYVSDGVTWNPLTISGVLSVVGGIGTTIDNTDPQNPVVNLKPLTSTDSSITSIIVGTDVDVVVDDVNTFEQFFNAFPNNTANLMGETLVGSSKWWGGCLAPNGKIYCVPSSDTTVLVIDPSTNTTSTFGALPAGSQKWRGGVLAPNGKIYGVPFLGSDDVVIIDTNTDTASTMGVSFPGERKWQGAVLAPNGKIYGIPSFATDVLVIDPLTDTAALMGVVLSGQAWKWAGGELAPNGKIYCIPEKSLDVLIIDPNTNTVSTIPIPLPPPPGDFDGRRWSSSAYSPVTKKIYGIPDFSSDVIIIDVVTDTVSYMGATIAGAGWVSGNIAPNGLIYCAPFVTSDVLIIDPQANTATLMGVSFPGFQQWSGQVLSENGMMFSVPHSSTDVLIIKTGPPSDFTSGINHDGILMKVPWEFVLSKYFNKF